MDAILSRILEFTAKDKDISILSGLSNVSEPAKLPMKKIAEIENVAIGVLCFSKGRPYQLHQLLLSIKNYFDTYPEVIELIYVPDGNDTLYESVLKMHPEVRARIEVDFQKDLLESIESISNKASHVMFCVDDLIFLQEFSVKEYVGCLSPDSNLFSLQLKLHPGIIYSHSGSKVSFPPRLTAHKTITKKLTYFTYPMSGTAGQGGGSEWRYPFDLCASVYRVKDIQRILEIVTEDLATSPAVPNNSSTNPYTESVLESLGSSTRIRKYEPNSLSNPNKLETTGNKVYFNTPELYKQYTHCACTSKFLACVVTVNQVQSTYDVPIYRNGGIGSDLHRLNNLLNCRYIENVNSATVCTKHPFANVHTSTIACTNARNGSSHVAGNMTNIEHNENLNEDPAKHSILLDFSRYLNSNFLSVHVGDVYFKPAVAKGLFRDRIYRNPELVLVSVLLPVYNATKYLKECLDSLLLLPQGLPFELIIIDDGSTDNSLEIIHSSVNNAEKSHIPMVVIPLLENKGLIYALNMGQMRCKTNFIARIDADDICEPYRLKRQYEFLCANKHINVVASQAIVFSDTQPLDNNSNHSSSIVQSMDNEQFSPYLAANLPTHPVLIEWEMLFRCAIVHPSVMFRRDVVLQCGSYGESGMPKELASNDANSTSSCGTADTNVHDSCKTDSSANYASIEGVECIEDYSLWCKVLDRHPLSIACVPDALLNLRLHIDSKSKVEAGRAKRAAQDLQYLRICDLLLSDQTTATVDNGNTAIAVDREAFNTLVDPNTLLLSEGSGLAALQLLEKAFSAFKKRHFPALTSSVLANRCDSCDIPVRNEVTGEVESIPTSSVDSSENNTTLLNLLNFSKFRLEKRILIACVTRYPANKEFSRLLGELETRCGAGGARGEGIMDKNEASKSILKDLLLSQCG